MADVSRLRAVAAEACVYVCGGGHVCVRVRGCAVWCTMHQKREPAWSCTMHQKQSGAAAVKSGRAGALWGVGEAGGSEPFLSHVAATHQTKTRASRWESTVFSGRPAVDGLVSGAPMATAAAAASTARAHSICVHVCVCVCVCFLLRHARGAPQSPSNGGHPL